MLNYVKLGANKPQFFDLELKLRKEKNSLYLLDEPSVESSTEINSGEAVGIAIGVLVLVLILLGLAYYFYRNGCCVRNHAREHGDSGESTTVNIHTVPSSPSASPPPSSEASPPPSSEAAPPSPPPDDQQYNGPTVPLELGKDQGSL